MRLPREAFIRVDVAVEPDLNPVLVALAKRLGLSDERAIIAARIATNKRYAVEAEASASAEVLGPLASWRVRRTRRGDKYYELVWPSGLRARWLPPDKFLSMPIERRVEALSDVVYAVLEDDGRGMVVKKLVPLRTRADYQSLAKLLAAAKELEAARGYTALAGAAALLHTVPEKRGTVFAMGLRYALLAMRGLVHVMEWSRRAVMKSTTFSTMEAYGRWWHLTGERPSLATLIGDARTGVSRLAGVDGVAFDEIGSWQRSRAADDEGFWSAIRSGLANCVWKRAKGGEKAIVVRRCLPSYWAGNPVDAPLEKTPPVEHSRLWLRRQGLDAEELDAMLSRFAVHWGVVDSEVSDDAMRGIHGMVPSPGVVRALIESFRSVQRRVEPPNPPDGLRDRQAPAFRLVYPAFLAVVGDRDWAFELASCAVRGLLVVTSDGPECMG